jgi:predicted nucleic acid-binding protein
MEHLVIDTSALLAVLLNEPEREALIDATQGRGLVAAPSLPWEVGNALVAGVRRQRLSTAALLEAWGSYGKVPVRLAEIAVARALEIAVEFNVYAYDAYVLEAARAERLPLLTLDRGLAQVARRLGLTLMEVEG